MDLRKVILIFTGTVCVALGVLGMFLTLLLDSFSTYGRLLPPLATLCTDC